MSIYYQDEQVTVLAGDCLTVMADMPAGSVHAIVTDPPYGLGFMGREWDGLPPGEPWARECLRVLKPGGYLLAFGGSRTWHRLAVAVEDAGFEIRDSIAWLYGSGFPKSLDVSKAIDKAGRRDYVQAAIDLGLEVPGNNLHDWTKAEHSPGDTWWAQFKAHLSPDDWQRLERAVVGSGISGATAGMQNLGPSGIRGGEYDVTAPATDAARQWQGWGTALKPAFEPIVVARKTLTGTVAGNVLEHGTGALNIDGCRVETTDDLNGGAYAEQGNRQQSSSLNPSGMNVPGKTVGREFAQPSGRWPTNVVLDDTQAAELDRQSGITRDGVAVNRNRGDERPMTVAGTPRKVLHEDHGYGGEGGASRFFPTFRYEAKAPTDQRPRVNGIAHPTVKPLDLMRWLVRLVTPPDGTVLDPFAGSGTTLEAALIEGFQCIGIEREADYLPLIRARITKPLETVLDLGGIA